MTLQLDIFDRNYTCVLEGEALRVFRRPLEDGVWGGYQHLAYRLQQREAGGTFTITEDEAMSAFTKAWAYGDGTWEQYFRRVVTAARRAGWAPTPAGYLDVLERHNAVRARSGREPLEGLPE